MTGSEVNAYVRCFTEKPPKVASPGPKPKRAGLDEPSEHSVIFDCETTTDASQALRFGFFQVRKRGRLLREGIFYDRVALIDAEFALL